MFAAAVITDGTIRDQLVSGIHSYASAGIRPHNNLPFTVVYDPVSSDELVNVNGGTDGGGINR